MKKILKSIWVNFLIFLEILKSFLIMSLVVIAIFVALSSIIHNVFKIREIYSEDTLGYKTLVPVSNNRMNVRVVGDGDRTVVILSSFGMPSPIIQYKAYTDSLVSNGYRVVILEYFGYGYSLSSKDERTVAYFAKEINEALNSAEIFGTYTIIANGISGIYAEAYVNSYADNVEKLILIDSIYPATINEKYIQESIKDKKFNIKLSSYAEMVGYARILSYLKPEIFKIDKMEQLGFSKKDIAFYRKMIANRFYTKTMRNEYNVIDKNMKMFKDYKFPENLSTIQILSSEYVDEFNQLKNNNSIKKDVNDYAEDLITNSELQKIFIIEGEKDNLNLSSPTNVIETILNN